MTIDRYDPEPASSPLILTSQDVALRRLAEWARSADAAHHIAETLVKTSFVPEAFRGKPGEATAAILAGLEVGLQPMAALRSFDVIQGQAAPRALTLRAIVQAHGHEIVLDESTATTCKVRARRAGTSTWQTVRWTIDRARSLNLLTKANWKAQPQAMLVARATSEACRLIAADAILGIGYSIEELTDGTGAGIEPQLAPQATTEASETTPAGKRKMSRTRTRPTAPEPVELEQPDDPAEPEPDTPSEAQTRLLMAVFSDLGLHDRDDRLNITTTILGRPIETSKDLTRDEASRLIDQLQRIQTGEHLLVADGDGWTIVDTPVE